MASTIDVAPGHVSAHVPGQVLTTEDDALEHIHGICFKTGPPTRIGVELEWLLVRAGDPAATVSLPVVAAHLAPLQMPGGSSISYEPGGQLELSSRPHDNPMAVVSDLSADLEAVLGRLGPLNVTLAERALDCARPPVRQLDSPRYAAMAEYFAHSDPVTGPAMMCCCVGLQVSLDAGETRPEVAARWRLLHELGPALIAAFANSPAPGWVSRRQGIWQELDPARTAPPTGDDPVAAWGRYALDAPVMMLRGERWLARPGFTFGDWVGGRTSLGRPTVEDLEYHLTTLFPPVRPRGWFEVRYLDAQPRAWWPVPVLVMWELMRDLNATATAIDPEAATPSAWGRAARSGLADPAIARTAGRLLELAVARLDGEARSLVAEFADQYTLRGRAPADDLQLG